MNLTYARRALLAVSLCHCATALSADYEMMKDLAVERVNHARDNAPIAVDGAFGEQQSLYNGTVTFSNTDISIPGNSSLPVEVRRSFSVEDRREVLGGLQAGGELGGFGEWNIEIPNLHGTFAADYGWDGLTNLDARCSQPSIPKSSIGPFWAYHHYWDNYLLDVPGAGTQQLLFNNVSGVPQPTNGTTYPWITKDFWVVSCKATTANGYPGEAFYVTSPDGVRYTMDWAVTKATSGLTRSSENGPVSFYLERVALYFLVTKIEDRFGNWVTYTYSGDRLTSIQSNDGRDITLTYHPSGHIATATSETGTSDARTWTYAYTGDRLSTVTRPDASTWVYGHTGLLQITSESGPSNDGNPNDPDSTCSPSVASGSFTYTVTNPTKAVGSFSFDTRRHWRTFAPWNCVFVPSEGSYLEIPIYFDVFSLVGKTVTGPNLSPMTWSYLYEPGSNQYVINYYTYCQQQPQLCPTTKRTSVTGPNSTFERYTFGIKYEVNEGQLLLTERGASAATIVQTEATTFVTAQDITGDPANYPFPSAVGSHPRSVLGDRLNAVWLRPQKSVVTTHNGDQYTRTTTKFEAYGRPELVSQSGAYNPLVQDPLPGSRIDETLYYNSTALWVLGQVRRVRNVDLDAIQSRVTFDSTTALPQNFYSFEVLQRTVAFEADGTVESITVPATVGTGRTEFYNWHRGIPQRIVHPDAHEITAVVSNSGDVLSITDERLSTTAYGYDGMGRLQSVTYPTGDLVTWTPETIARIFTTGTELGLPAGTRRIRNTVGTHRVTTYYDALMRPILTQDTDTASGSSIYTRASFDHRGLQTFSSYPSFTSNIAAGTQSTYDSLGRLFERWTTDSVRLERIDYLPGNKRNLTDADGKVTLVTYQAFGVPEFERALTIESPEGQTTEIERDHFGKLKTVKQSGLYEGTLISATRTFVYNSSQQLCRRIDPETASTVWGYNVAGQVAWTKRGLNGTGCPAMPANSIQYSYDERGRKVFDDYAGGGEDVTYGYDPVGNLETVANQDATWTYAYNKRNLLEREQADIDGKTFVIDQTYNGLAYVTSLATPAHTISYAPNARGAPTTVGTYVTGIQYHPNGLASQYTLVGSVPANDLQFSRTLDSRLRPLLQQTMDGATPVQQYQYGYSHTGDLVTFNDLLDDGDDATLTYDDLHRLETATGLWGGYGYKYDPLNNIRERTGQNPLVYTYDQPKNRLHTITGSQTRTYGYNTRGDVTGDGIRVYTPNNQGQIVSITGVATYEYDGNGRRIKSVAGSTTEYSLYDRSGQLVYREQGSTKYSYLSLGGQTVVELKKIGSTTTPTYLHTDLLGSPRKATTTTKNVLWQEHYDPYGLRLNGATGRIGYTGHVNDDESGLTYMQARFYDPLVGRFLSSDPVHFVDDNPYTFNRYSYANNNPYKYRDPDGEFADVIFDSADVLLSAGRVFGGVAAYTVGALTGNTELMNEAANGVAEQRTDMLIAGAAVIVPGVNAATLKGARKVANTCCFVAGTLVETENGLRPIEQIKVGDLVLSRDERTGETGLKPVTQVISRHQREIWTLRLTVSDGHAISEAVFETTDDHPWRRMDGKWVATADLTPGMQIATASSAVATVRLVERTNRAESTYNLEVSDFHTYFVGESKVWVHNATCTPRPADGTSMSTDDALDQADSFLGPNSRVEGPGRQVSEDGTRRVRMTDSDLARQNNHAGAPHMNFEEGQTVTKANGKDSFVPDPGKNSHVYLPEEK